MHIKLKEQWTITYYFDMLRVGRALFESYAVAYLTGLDLWQPCPRLEVAGMSNCRTHDNSVMSFIIHITQGLIQKYLYPTSCV